MEDEIKELKARISQIEERNARVEKDKNRETSSTRIFLICLITYFIAYVYMSVANVKNIFYAAFVPVIGFYLSSFSIPYAKKIWLEIRRDR